MLDKFVTIGYTKKTYGSKGQIKMVVEAHYLEDLIKSDFVFINYMGKPLPFFIETIEDMGDLLLKVEEVDTPEEAKSIVAKDLYLRETDLSTLPEKRDENGLLFGFLKGFDLWDASGSAVGQIIDIQQYPQQEIATVQYGEREVLIPLHENLITAIDEAQNKITLQLPEGLLEL